MGDGATAGRSLKWRFRAAILQAGLLPGIGPVLVARFAVSVAIFAALPFVAADLLVDWRLSPANSALATAAILIGGRLGGGLLGGVIDRCSPLRVQRWTIFLTLIFCLTALAGGGSRSVLTLLAFQALAVTSAAIQITTRAMLTHGVEGAALPGAFAMLAVSANVGMAIGPVAGVLARAQGAASLAFLLPSLALFVALWATKDGGATPAGNGLRERAEGPGLSRKQSGAAAARLAAALLLQFLTWAMIQQIFVALPWYVAAKGEASALALFFVVQSVTVILLLVVVGAALRGSSESLLFHVYGAGTLALAFSFLILGVGNQDLSVAVIAFAIALTLSEAASVPAGDALIARLAPHAPGRSFGLMTIACACGMAAGSIAAWGLLRIEAVLLTPELYWFWIAGAFSLATAAVWAGATLGARRPAIPAGELNSQQE